MATVSDGESATLALTMANYEDSKTVVERKENKADKRKGTFIYVICVLDIVMFINIHIPIYYIK